MHSYLEPRVGSGWIAGMYRWKEAQEHRLDLRETNSSLENMLTCNVGVRLSIWDSIVWTCGSTQYTCTSLQSTGFASSMILL